MGAQPQKKEKSLSEGQSPSAHQAAKPRAIFPDGRLNGECLWAIMAADFF